MASEAISSSILLIGAVLGAAVLITAILPAIFSAGDTFGTVAHSADEQLKTDFKIINSYATTTSPLIAKVWMKNVGGTRLSIYDLQKSDVFFGQGNSITHYSYATGGTEKTFEYAVLKTTQNGYWEVGDTVELTLHLPAGTISSDSVVLYFSLSTPQSIRRTVTFSPTA